MRRPTTLWTGVVGAFSPDVRAQFAAEQHHRPESLLSEGAGINPDRAVELIPDALSADGVSDDGGQARQGADAELEHAPARHERGAAPRRWWVNGSRRFYDIVLGAYKTFGIKRRG